LYQFSLQLILGFFFEICLIPPKKSISPKKRLSFHALHGYAEIKAWFGQLFTLIPETAMKPNYEVCYAADKDGEIIAELSVALDHSEWHIMMRSKADEPIEIEVFGQDKSIKFLDLLVAGS